MLIFTVPGMAEFHHHQDWRAVRMVWWSFQPSLGFRDAMTRGIAFCKADRRVTSWIIDTTGIRLMISENPDWLPRLYVSQVDMQWQATVFRHWVHETAVAKFFMIEPNSVIVEKSFQQTANISRDFFVIVPSLTAASKLLKDKGDA
jgi:hypothetical protein